MKKYFARFLLLICIFSLCLGSIGVTEATGADVAAPNRSSDYIDSYAASSNTGAKREVVISYDTVATNYMEWVGVAHIVIQEKNGSTWRGVTTYWGSVANGMIVTNAITHSGSISYNGTSGKQYRAVVTFYAGDADDDTHGDYRTKTTNTVTAR